MSKERPDTKPLLSNPVVSEIAAKKGKTAAQVLIRWSIQGGVVVIPKSVNPTRIEENFKVWDFELTNEDMRALDDLNIDFRFFAQDWHGVPRFT